MHIEERKENSKGSLPALFIAWRLAHFLLVHSQIENGKRELAPMGFWDPQHAAQSYRWLSEEGNSFRETLNWKWRQCRASAPGAGPGHHPQARVWLCGDINNQTGSKLSRFTDLCLSVCLSRSLWLCQLVYACLFRLHLLIQKYVSSHQHWVCIEA